MRLVFMGTSNFATPSLHALVAAGHQVTAVVTQPDRPAGRGRRPLPSPVKAAAQELGLPLLQPERASAPDSIEQIRHFQPELLVVAAYGQLLSPALLAVPPRGAVNVHASLLPRYRGAAPVQRAIMADEEETGVTIMWMTERLDAGDIILQECTPIGPRETAGELLARLAGMGARLLVAALALIVASTAPRRPQDERQATLAPSLRKEERLIPWQEPAAAVVARVRALSPRPGALTRHEGRQLKVLRARTLEKLCPAAGTAGQVVEISRDGIFVGAGVGCVLLEQLQPESGKIMTALEYARGYRVSPGQTLS